jgi:hypothetical protein
MERPSNSRRGACRIKWGQRRFPTERLFAGGEPVFGGVPVEDLDREREPGEEGPATGGELVPDLEALREAEALELPDVDLERVPFTAEGPGKHGRGDVRPPADEAEGGERPVPEPLEPAREGVHVRWAQSVVEGDLHAVPVSAVVKRDPPDLRLRRDGAGRARGEELEELGPRREAGGARVLLADGVDRDAVDPVDLEHADRMAAIPPASANVWLLPSAGRSAGSTRRPARRESASGRGASPGTPYGDGSGLRQPSGKHAKRRPARQGGAQLLLLPSAQRSARCSSGCWPRRPSSRRTTRTWSSRCTYT